MTLIGAMIAIAIIAVIAAVTAYVGLPAYRNHQNETLKPKFAEVTNALAPYKDAVERCAMDGSCVVAGALGGLGLGQKGVPVRMSTTYLADVAVAANGTITATATAAGGLAGETFVLTPTYAPGLPLAWSRTGTCKTRAAGPIC